MPISLGYTNASNLQIETQVVATDGIQAFTLQSISYNPGTYQLQVFVNGIRKTVAVDYQETSPTVVTFIVDPLNDVIIQDTALPNTITFVSSVAAVEPNFINADFTNISALGKTNLNNIITEEGGTGAAIDFSNVNFPAMSATVLKALGTALVNADALPNLIE